MVLRQIQWAPSFLIWQPAWQKNTLLRSRVVSSGLCSCCPPCCVCYVLTEALVQLQTKRRFQISFCLYLLINVRFQSLYELAAPQQTEIAQRFAYIEVMHLRHQQSKHASNDQTEWLSKKWQHDRGKHWVFIKNSTIVT